MKKEQLVETVMNWLGGDSAPADIRGKYRPGVVELYVGMAFDDLIVRVFQNSDSTKSNLDAYTKVYTVTIINAADVTGMQWISIPTITKKLLQIPNNKAIRRVDTRLSSSGAPIRCFYRELGANFAMDQLEVNTYLTNGIYEVLGDVIYFEKPAIIYSVTLWMVVPFSEYLDTDDLPAPLENNLTLLETVVSFLRQVPPEDKISDDNAVQV